MLLIEDFAMELKKYNLYIIELFERENLKLSDYIDVDRFKSIIEEQDIIYELNWAITNYLNKLTIDTTYIRSHCLHEVEIELWLRKLSKNIIPNLKKIAQG